MSSIGCRSDVSGQCYSDLGTKWGREATICFWKLFYQIFNDKTFYNFLYKILHSTKNKFDYVLYAKKHMKIGKQILENILLFKK